MNYSNYSEEDINEEKRIDLRKYERVEDTFEDRLEIAESIYQKLRNYIEFQGLDLLDIPSHDCIANLIPFLES